MKKYFACLLPLIALVISACGAKGDEVPDILLTPPAITVNVSRENCPSIEAEVGMWVAWNNIDTVSLPMKIEKLDKDGNVTGTGRSDVQPESTFAMDFTEAGNYRVYCTENADTYATITVK